MRAITVCQPYADLILLPTSKPQHKRTENRTWNSTYTGPLLIHAGKSKKWLQGDNYGLSMASKFGAILTG